jgi:hypothetical protein
VPGYLEEACRAADLVQLRADGIWVGGDVDDRHIRHRGFPSPALPPVFAHGSIMMDLRTAATPD